MRQAILDLIERCQRIEGFAGKHSCPLNGQVVLWEGVSDAGIEALGRLQTRGQIAFVARSPLVYLTDGQMLRLPIAKRRNHTYKRPLWYPVTLSTPAQVAAHTAPLRQSRRTQGTPNHVPRCA
ncbi:hypothetical protein ThidrDRAFT_3618 [Thiorhodococcus drewsii AZ1]|uniref:Uncharacterized protein n=1 Tax=Thiorhodococcus drewsii AZ1 TaxID=765913 RepID=G2E5Q5_9GAMM|nr:hypothetical protein [Thiorhodococcus drewsii]EGV28626.1 hypothetical protein ThidrDRAFT_3618 [Thiorhodococcus drewsii AZ1]